MLQFEKKKQKKTGMLTITMKLDQTKNKTDKFVM